MNEKDRQKLDEIEDKIDDIRINHLVHIYEVIGRLSGKMSVLIPLVIALIALIAGLYVLLIAGE